MIPDQAGFELRCDWGEAALRALREGSDAIIIVDLLSFSTTVEIAVARGAMVYPYRWNDPSAAEFAARKGALLAGPRSARGLSLSPASMLDLSPGARIVLPSLNGASLSLGTGPVPAFAGCLRNASSVARAAAACGRRISVIAAGERWPDGTLRPALEDWIGAGAILRALPGSPSPEARAAVAAYDRAAGDLPGVISATGSGRELIASGFADDVRLACDERGHGAVPRLFAGAYQAEDRAASAGVP